MNDDAGRTTGELAAELALIRYVIEMQIDFYQAHDRWPSPGEVQRAWHSLDRSTTPTTVDLPV